MAHIQVPENIPGIRALLAFRPETAGALGALADALLCAPNTLSRGERELIAARVSALNHCAFCRDSHAALAACYLADDERLVAAVVADPECAPISDKLKSLLAVAERVCEGGQSVRTVDIECARLAGASDVEIHDTVLIAAAFCMFNRYVDGLGAWTPTDPAGYRQRAQLVAAHGYSASLPPNTR